MPFASSPHISQGPMLLSTLSSGLLSTSRVRVSHDLALLASMRSAAAAHYHCPRTLNNLRRPSDERLPASGDPRCETRGPDPHSNSLQDRYLVLSSLATLHDSYASRRDVDAHSEGQIRGAAQYISYGVVDASEPSTAVFFAASLRFLSSTSKFESQHALHRHHLGLRPRWILHRRELPAWPYVSSHLSSSQYR